ncbi:MAG TPA: sugar ABC transporter permease [Dongiaceae bacterium]|jgi:ABC-type sugar transport system permease subunit|nr:sugar ABC transporter permease [Dongiaceae bacterium]
MRRAERWLPWIYSLPMIGFVGLIFAYPMLSLLKFSVEHVGRSVYLPTRFVGAANFQFIFTDSLFLGAIANNLKLFLCVPVLLVLSVLLAQILHDRPRGWKIYRALLFVPYILSIPVVGVVFGYLFQYQGQINSGLRAIGLDALAADWLGDPALAMPTIMAVIVWKELGFGIILCLARLSSVGEQYFEAARVDGANWFQILRHVTVPQLAPTLAFYAVVEMINMLSWVFSYIYVMTRGGPQNSTVVTEFYIYQQVFQNSQIGVGAAASLVLLALVGVLLAARQWLEARLDHYAAD